MIVIFSSLLMKCNDLYPAFRINIISAVFGQSVVSS